MKIAILVRMFLPKHIGGVEISTYNIAERLSKNGHEVHVVTSWDSGLPEKSVEQGFVIHRIKRPDIKAVGVIIFWLRMSAALKKINPDIIHAQGMTMAVPALLVKTFFKKRYIVWGRGFDVYFPWKFKKLISRLSLKYADVVIALTKDMRNRMKKICDRAILTIPNGIDLEKFKGLPAKEPIRTGLGISSSDKVIIFAGTLRPVKGVEHLIRAMSVVAREDVRARLILIGDGAEGDHLRGLVKELGLGEFVNFIGEVSNERIPEYLVASDILALPSLSEGFPVVVLEGMASGLPVVASRVGGLPDIIEDGKNGFLVKPAEPKEIAEKILLLLKDEELRKNISCNNRIKVSDYDWTGIIRKLEEAYRCDMEV